MSWEISPWISSRLVLKLSGEEERKEFLFVSVFNQRKILGWYSYQKQGDSECINLDLAGEKIIWSTNDVSFVIVWSVGYIFWPEEKVVLHSIHTRYVIFCEARVQISSGDDSHI